MMLKRLALDFLDLIFPPREICPFCGCRSPEMKVCGACHRQMKSYLKEPHCLVCGRFFNGRGESLCRDCRESSRPFKLVRAAGPYEGIIRESVRKLKYQNKRWLARNLANYMIAAARNHPGYSRAGAVVPVPMSPGRLRDRGFNQAELLAREVASGLGLPFICPVQKIRETKAQTGLERVQRLNNLKRTFKVADKTQVRGKVILLVDDVVTTVATMEAVAGALSQSGADLVLGLAAASGRTIA